MKDVRSAISLLMATMLAVPTTLFGASHREAPITALDRAADITDYYSFVSYEDPTKVIFILNVDPLLEPSNGPNYFPFDPNILYSIKVDNSYDAVEDVSLNLGSPPRSMLPACLPGSLVRVPASMRPATLPSTTPPIPRKLEARLVRPLSRPKSHRSPVRAQPALA